MQTISKREARVLALELAVMDLRDAIEAGMGRDAAEHEGDYMELHEQLVLLADRMERQARNLKAKLIRPAPYVWRH